MEETWRKNEDTKRRRKKQPHDFSFSLVNKGKCSAFGQAGPNLLSSRLDEAVERKIRTWWMTREALDLPPKRNCHSAFCAFGALWPYVPSHPYHLFRFSFSSDHLSPFTSYPPNFLPPSRPPSAQSVPWQRSFQSQSRIQFLFPPLHSPLLPASPSPYPDTPAANHFGMLIASCVFVVDVLLAPFPFVHFCCWRGKNVILACLFFSTSAPTPLPSTTTNKKYRQALINQPIYWFYMSFPKNERRKEREVNERLSENKKLMTARAINAQHNHHQESCNNWCFYHNFFCLSFSLVLFLFSFHFCSERERKRVRRGKDRKCSIYAVYIMLSGFCWTLHLQFSFSRHRCISSVS